MQENYYVCEQTEPNNSKAWFVDLLHHPARNQSGSINSMKVGPLIGQQPLKSSLEPTENTY